MPRAMTARIRLVGERQAHFDQIAEFLELSGVEPHEANVLNFALQAGAKWAHTMSQPDFTREGSEPPALVDAPKEFPEELIDVLRLIQREEKPGTRSTGNLELPGPIVRELRNRFLIGRAEGPGSTTYYWLTNGGHAVLAELDEQS